MQNSRLIEACFPIKIDVRYDWWRRPHQCSQCVSGVLYRLHRLHVFTNVGTRSAGANSFFAKGSWPTGSHAGHLYCGWRRSLCEEEVLCMKPRNTFWRNLLITGNYPAASALRHFFITLPHPIYAYQIYRLVLVSSFCNACRACSQRKVAKIYDYPWPTEWLVRIIQFTFFRVKIKN